MYAATRQRGAMPGSARQGLAARSLYGVSGAEVEEAASGVEGVAAGEGGAGGEEEEAVAEIGVELGGFEGAGGGERGEAVLLEGGEGEGERGGVVAGAQGVLEGGLNGAGHQGGGELNNYTHTTSEAQEVVPRAG